MCKELLHTLQDALISHTTAATLFGTWITMRIIRRANGAFFHSITVFTSCSDKYLNRNKRTYVFLFKSKINKDHLTSSTLAAVLADVSINIIPFSCANASPSSLCTSR